MTSTTNRKDPSYGLTLLPVEGQAGASLAAGNDHEFAVDRGALTDGHLDLRF